MRKKLDDRGKKYVFLGVSEVSKAYKLYNPLTKKIMTSRDVVFDEENTWSWDKKQPTQVLADNEAEVVALLSEILAKTIPLVAESLPTTREETSGTT